MARGNHRSGRGQPRRRALSRQLIVDAAIAYVDDHGDRGFTMRDIAKMLGVEAMALYRYVNGREDLLEAVVSCLLDDATAQFDDAQMRTWQGYLQTLAFAIRQIAVNHPSNFSLLATRHPAAPWLRPPLRSVEVVQRFLETLSGFGFSDELVVQTYRSFSSFLLGSLYLEAAQRDAHRSPIEEPVEEGEAQIPHQHGAVDWHENATIRRFQPLLSEDRSAEEFEVTLATLLHRLELSVSR